MLEVRLRMMMMILMVPNHLIDKVVCVCVHNMSECVHHVTKSTILLSLNGLRWCVCLLNVVCCFC